jgi:predicted DNA-binding transcriptional regulator AlpA
MADTATGTTDRKPRAGTVPKAAPQPSSGERLLPPNDAANFLRVSVSFLAKARMRGDGPPYVKLGRSVRYRESDLVHWMKSRLRLSTSER